MRTDKRVLLKRESNQTFGSVSRHHNLKRRLITPLLSSTLSITAKSIAKARRVPTGLMKEICPFNAHFPKSGHKCSSQIYFSGLISIFQPLLFAFLQLLDHLLLEKRRTQFNLAPPVRSILWHISIVLLPDHRN